MAEANIRSNRVYIPVTEMGTGVYSVTVESDGVSRMNKLLVR